MLTTYYLVCQDPYCATVIEQRIAAEPINGWHTVSDRGKQVVHMMDVKLVLDEEDSG